MWENGNFLTAGEKLVQPFWKAISKVEHLNYQQHIPLEKLFHMNTRRYTCEYLSWHCL